MSTTSTSDRKTLRDLPVSAKLVVTVFLIAVGIGYLWAMVQLHFKHGGGGEPLPTVADTVAHFSGREWPLENDPPVPADEPAKEDAKKEPEAEKGKEGVAKIKTILEKRCLECHAKGGEKDDVPLATYDELSKYLKNGSLLKVLTGPRDKWSKNSMVQAFFEKSEENKKAWAERVAKEKGLEAEREAERLAVVAWIEKGASEDAYKKDAFVLPNKDEFKPLTKEFRAGDLKWFESPVIKKEGEAAPVPKPVNKRALAKKKQSSVESLTQSTHAHLLTFAVLWGSIGFLFAFTSLSGFIRCTLSPLVVAAQVVDIMCWWLARLNGVGPYFALVIMGTGAVVGMGLGAQITLILFTMWDKKGKVFILLLAALFIGGFGLAYVKVIKPQLDEEKQLAAPKA